jgi:hypothetical protein
VLLIIRPGTVSPHPTHAYIIRIKVTYRDAKGNDIKTVEGNEGDDLLILAHEYDIDLEGEFESRQLIPCPIPRKIMIKILDPRSSRLVPGARR